jgi:hypothetical protein
VVITIGRIRIRADSKIARRSYSPPR